MTLQQKWLLVLQYQEKAEDSSSQMNKPADVLKGSFISNKDNIECLNTRGSCANVGSALFFFFSPRRAGEGKVEAEDINSC
jgi:hypothetical protein